MRKNIITLILSFFIISAEAQNMDAFKWMVGTWRIDGPRATVIEHWSMVNDSTLTGHSKLIKSTKETILQETLNLVYRLGTWYYISKVEGQNNNLPVKFKIIFQRNGEFISENPEHDFPQRISYRSINSQMYASIEGWQNGKYAKRNFDFKSDR